MISSEPEHVCIVRSLNSQEMEDRGKDEARGRAAWHQHRLQLQAQRSAQSGRAMDTPSKHHPYYIYNAPVTIVSKQPLLHKITMFLAFCLLLVLLSVQALKEARLQDCNLGL